MLVIITEKIKKWFPISIRLRAGGIYLGVIIPAFLFMGIYIIVTVSRGLYNNEITDTFAKANIISSMVSETMTDNTDREEYHRIISSGLAGTGLRGILLDGSGKVLYDTNGSANAEGMIFTSSFLSEAFSGQQQGEVAKNAEGKKVLSAAVPVEYAGNTIGVIYLTKELGGIQRLISSLGWGLATFFIAILIIIGVLSIGMGYMVKSPLSEFVTTAREISKGNFDKRIAPQKNAEMNQLAEAMNYMCAELEHLETKRRKFVSDASHELKTPMATIKLICDSIATTDAPDMGMVKEFLSDLSDEVDRLTRIIEKLLLLSKLDSEERRISPELVDFGMMLQRIKNKLAPMAVNKNITVALDVQEDMPPVMMDYDRIWESVYNIVDNAIKYSKIGSVVKVSAAVDEAELTVRVFDSGRGIPDEYKERVFERFYRLDDSRARETGGTGLGLSIAREAVLLHNGQLYAEDNPDGGSCFVMKLPIASEQASK